FTEADNETTAPVAIVNEAFVKRFFKSDEDPIGQHFGLDEPQNVGTFTIVGVVRDARWQSFQFRLPPRPMFYVPLAQKVNYVNSVMTRVEYQSHFISGLMLVTKLGPGALEPLVIKAMADVDPRLTFMNARGDRTGTRRAAGNRRREIARRAVVRREVLGSGRPGCGYRIADAERVGRRADSRQSGGINSADGRAPVGIAPAIASTSARPR